MESRFTSGLNAAKNTAIKLKKNNILQNLYLILVKFPLKFYQV